MNSANLIYKYYHLILIIIIIILTILICDQNSNNNITINSGIKILLKVNHKIPYLY